MRLDIPAVPQEYQRGYLQRIFTRIESAINDLRAKTAVTKTSSFQIGPSEYRIICNGSASITVTLPNPATYSGPDINIKTIAAYTVVSASSNVVPITGGAAGTAILPATAGRWATLVSDGTNWVIAQQGDATGGGGGLSDGDYGDITVSGGATVLTIDNDVVTYAKMQNVSATNRLLGRGSAGAGDTEEISLGTGLSMSGTTLNGPAWTEVEVDFGSTPVYDATFTITDASITSSAVKMVLVPCGKAATGRTADDWQWDGGTFVANPGTGSATCYATFTPGPIVGKRMLQYQIG